MMLERPWRAVRRLAERFALSATLGELGALAEVSGRQVDRFVSEFTRAFPMSGGGWRAVTVHFRLKTAVLFLSAEDATIAEVAHAVGYGSADAMAKAFRDAGVPSPSTIREALRR